MIPVYVGHRYIFVMLNSNSNEPIVHQFAATKTRLFQSTIIIPACIGIII